MSKMEPEYYRICRNCREPVLVGETVCRCGTALPSKIEIFLSYSHRDESLLKDLKSHLIIMQRTGMAMLWYDGEIEGGDDWDEAIFAHLDTAEVILLLISSDFIASDFCYSREMMRALERHERNEACVIPVILRPSPWHTAPFGRLQAVPDHGKAVTEWSNKDSALLNVTQRIRGAIEKRFGTRP